MLDVLSRSSLLRGAADISHWAGAVRDIVDKSALSAHVKMILTKAAMPRLPSTFSPQYGVIPQVRFCHAVVGNLAPSKDLTNPFQVEVSKEILKKGVGVIATRTRLTDRTFTFDFNFPTGTARRGDFKIESVDVDLRDGRNDGPGYADLSAKILTHPLTTETGYSWNIEPKVSFQIYRDNRESLKPNQWRIAGTVEGTLQPNELVGRLLGGAVGDAATAVFPALAAPINSYIDTQLREFVAMPAPITVKNVAVAAKTFTFEVGPGTLDFATLAKKYLMIPESLHNNAEISQIKVASDRIILGGRAQR
jgi:hypothetical protein